jgi:hypothetical protein
VNDIFISYLREDRAKAAAIAALFQGPVGPLDTVIALPPERIAVRSPETQSDLQTVLTLLARVQKTLSQVVTEDGVAREPTVAGWESGSLLIFLWRSRPRETLVTGWAAAARPSHN